MLLFVYLFIPKELKALVVDYQLIANYLDIFGNLWFEFHIKQGPHLAWNSFLAKPNSRLNSSASLLGWSF